MAQKQEKSGCCGSANVVTCCPACLLYVPVSHGHPACACVCHSLKSFDDRVCTKSAFHMPSLKTALEHAQQQKQRQAQTLREKPNPKHG
eukprot:s10_g44.t1